MSEETTDQVDVTNSEETVEPDLGELSESEDPGLPEGYETPKPAKAKKPPVPKKSPTPKPSKKAATPVKATKKAPAKKSAKPTKSTKAAKKSAKKAATPKNPPRDDARKVAACSGGKLTTDQVRVLRALKSGKTTSMNDIKSGCGIDPDGKYSGGFLKGIHALQASRYIKVDDEEGVRGHTYSITPAGKTLLDKSEAAYKAKA
jgi:hypothetical protein